MPSMPARSVIQGASDGVPDALQPPPLLPQSPVPVVLEHAAASQSSSSPQSGAALQDESRLPGG